MQLLGLSRPLRNADADALALGPDDEGPLLLGLREAGLDVPEGDGVGADAEARPPLLGDGLGHAGDAGLGHGVVDLAGVAVDAAGRADVDDAAGLAVAHAEVGRRRPHQPERRRGVQAHDCLPLVVAHLVDHPVPRVPGVVHEDVQLAAPELGRPRHQRRMVRAVQHVPRHRERAPRRGAVDARRHGFGFGCEGITPSVSQSATLKGGREGDISRNHVRRHVCMYVCM